MTPALKHVASSSPTSLLAPLVGAFADSMPKGRVMLITNGIKVVGCMLMLFTLHPLLAYAVVGFGAAAYSPAKYGILTELLPPQQLVVANGWIEGTTVGVDHPRRADGRRADQPQGLDGAARLRPAAASTPGSTRRPRPRSRDHACSTCIAAVFNWFIPDTGVDHRMVNRNPLFLIREFAHCVALLWRDRLGQISLATTTLFWGAGATLQFIVIDWAAKALGLRPVAGVDAAGRRRRRHRGRRGARRALRHRCASRCSVLPIGIAMGLDRDDDDLRHRAAARHAC